MSDLAVFDDPKALAATLREKLSVSAAYASELANGRRQPSLTLAVRIEQELGIPAAAWIGRPDPKSDQDAAA